MRLFKRLQKQSGRVVVFQPVQVFHAVWEYR